MQARTDRVSRGRHGYGRAGTGSNLRQVRALRIAYNKLFLRNAIHALCLQNLGFLEAIIKNSKPAAQHNLGRTALASNSPGKSQARRPVCVILNPSLSFKAQTVAESDVGAYLPIVLVVKSSIEVAHYQRRTADGVSELGSDWDGGVSCILQSKLIRNRTGLLS